MSLPAGLQTRVDSSERGSAQSQNASPLSTARPAPGDPLEPIVTALLAALGIDVDSQHFRETPRRVARFYRESTRGYAARPADILKTFRSATHELIVVSNVDFYALCPHHLLPYGGQVHLGYVPDGRIVGVSKIPRLVHALAARMVVQEDLVADIADAFMGVVRPQGCVVQALARHDCVAARGVRCRDAAMTTIAVRGSFREQAPLVNEFRRIVIQGRHPFPLEATRLEVG